MHLHTYRYATADSLYVEYYYCTPVMTPFSTVVIFHLYHEIRLECPNICYSK